MLINALVLFITALEIPIVLAVAIAFEKLPELAFADIPVAISSSVFVVSPVGASPVGASPVFVSPVGASLLVLSPAVPSSALVSLAVVSSPPTGIESTNGT